MSARQTRRILAALLRLETKVVRLETKVDILQQQQQPPSSGSPLPHIGGAIGLVAGAITTWQTVTGRA